MYERVKKYQNGDIAGWCKCKDYKEAQVNANKGVVTIGIEPKHQVIITPNNISNEASVPDNVGKVLISQSGLSCFYDRTLSYAWKKADREKVQFFSYKPNEAYMTNKQYYDYIHATALKYPTVTYTWIHNVMAALNIPYANGNCNQDYNQYTNNEIEGWVECSFAEAQINANNGKATIAISPKHQVVVTPNNVSVEEIIPQNIGDVLVSQSWLQNQEYDIPLSEAWVSKRVYRT